MADAAPTLPRTSQPQPDPAAPLPPQAIIQPDPAEPLPEPPSEVQVEVEALPLPPEDVPQNDAEDKPKSGSIPPLPGQVVPTTKAVRLPVKKMIDILNPKRELLPVHLPTIGDSRKQDLSEKKRSRTSINSDQMLDGRVPFVEGDNAPNPFQYPPSIKQFIEVNASYPKFKDKQVSGAGGQPMREKLECKTIAKIEPERKEEIKEDIEDKEAALMNKLMQGTSTYNQSKLVLQRIKPFLQPGFKPSLAHDYRQVVWRAQHGLHINHLQKVSRKLHTEYIMQRKSVYYLRRAIRARKIALETISKTREFEETCLKDYEWLTAFTKEAFEDFLKENDDKTHEASRHAENALKEKLDKSLQVRQLSIQMNQMKSEIIATNESLRECKTYMRFLDDIAREIMRKDEEEEIRAQHREQQVKEELLGYLKQGISLKKAQQMVEDKAKELYDEYFQNRPHRSSFGGVRSTDFLTNLHREVRRYLGMPDEVILMPDEDEEQVQQAVRKSLDDDTDDDMIQEVAEQGNDAGFISPRAIVSGLVQRNKSRLLNVIEKQERKVFEKLLMGPETKKQIKNEEDEDGFNEYLLLKSLELVPGDEETDRRELASLSFTRPSQLLQIYSDMEEANLSLIQHSQASEEMLERVNHQIMTTRRNLNHRGRLLRDEINRMQANIDGNEERANALAMLVEMFTGGNYDVRQQQKLYKILQKHVAKVYRAAVGTIDHHLNPIMMLTSIEKNFEDLMYEIQAMPTDVVVQISRELDKERRELVRLEKMNQRKKVQQERISRQMDRAKAPIPRRKGRPLLARSRPPKVVIHLSQAELDKKAEEDEFNYFFGP